MEIKNVKGFEEMIGVVVETEEHGNVKIIGFNPHDTWGGKVHLYMGKAHMDTFAGSFQAHGLTGGALIVEKTDEPITEFEKK